MRRTDEYIANGTHSPRLWWYESGVEIINGNHSVAVRVLYISHVSHDSGEFKPRSSSCSKTRFKMQHFSVRDLSVCIGVDALSGGNLRKAPLPSNQPLRPGVYTLEDRLSAISSSARMCIRLFRNFVA